MGSKQRAKVNPERWNYRGRFAPSPTGPLHFGSLVAAVGSFLEAKAHGGEWYVRIEDLDSPRTVPGAAEEILGALESLRMAWDGEVLWQSSRSAAYAQALDQLRRRGLVYPCACSRREIADSAVSGIEGPVYPGTCRQGVAPGRGRQSLRVRTDPEIISIIDAVQGVISQMLERDIGDFVLRRADGVFAYQLAVVVDDAGQGITHVVRGADLLDSTPRQIYLQRLLGLPTPGYMHLPAAVNASGEKLSKQTLAPPVDVCRPVLEIHRVLEFLGQQPPADLLQADLATLWDWAIACWNPANIARDRVKPAPATRGPAHPPGT